jgi:hypothetical protein
MKTLTVEGRMPVPPGERFGSAALDGYVGRAVPVTLEPENVEYRGIIKAVTIADDRSYATVTVQFEDVPEVVPLRQVLEDAVMVWADAGGHRSSGEDRAIHATLVS